MSETNFPPPKRRLRWWKRLLIVFLLMVSLLLAAYGVFHGIGYRQLLAAIAEADRLDPGWRLQELEDQREAVPDQENSAKQVLAAVDLVPRHHDNLRLLYFSLLRAPLPQEVEPALARARRLADMPRGRYTVDWYNLRIEYLSSLKRPVNPYESAREYTCVPGAPPHLRKIQLVAALLRKGAAQGAQSGDLESALRCAQGILNTGRSLGDEPALLSYVTRTNCRGEATYALEETLAQGELSPAGLAALQKRLEEEEAFPLLLVALRGKRAWAYEVIQEIQSGRMTPGLSQSEPPTLFRLWDFFEEVFGGKQRQATQSQPDRRTLEDRLAPHYALARQLRHLNRCVEAAKLPAEEQLARIQQLEADWPIPADTALAPPRVSGIAEYCQRSQAELRCAIAGLAAERYRLVHGRWPESLSALVSAKLLRRIPLDPFDGVPLRFRRRQDGLLIYSISPNGRDQVHRLEDARVLDVSSFPRPAGFRLWDVALRPPADSGK
jgi:hypothetical protein